MEVPQPATDIKSYYKAVIIARMVEWANVNSEKRWASMEDALSMTLLHKNIWIPHKFRKLGTDSHELTKNVFKIWDSLYCQGKWKYNSPLISLTGTIFL